MLLSTVILSFNSARYLQRCLDNLITSFKNNIDECEIFIVDNGSKDNSKQIITEYQKQHPNLIKPIFFEENTGTTFSRNSALKKATGDYLLVLDSDAYVNKTAIDTLIETAKSDKRIGITVPKLSYGSGNFQLSCDQFPTLYQKFKRFLFLKAMEQGTPSLSSTTETHEVDYAISACWLISRPCFEDTGLLDEGIFYSPEDVDYCIRVWLSGYKIVYVPQAKMVHDAQELSRGFKISKFHIEHLKGLFYLFKKHQYFWSLKNLYKRMPLHKNNKG